MQVVVPSVSRADRLQGTTFALAVAVTSTGLLCGMALAFCGDVPGGAATPAADGAGMAGGGETTGGGADKGGGADRGGGESAGPGPSAGPGLCCARLIDEPMTSTTTIGKAGIRMEASLESWQPCA